MARQTDPKATFGAWLTNAALMTFVRLLGLLPYAWRNSIVAATLRGPLGRAIGFRKRIQRNLAHIYPDMPPKRAREIANQVLDNAARTFIENLFPAQFQKHNPHVELWGDGVQAYLDAQKQGRAVVLVSGHFGNHEALRIASEREGIRVGGLYRPMSNPYFHRHYLKAIQIDGKTGPLFPVGKDGTQGFIRALGNGHAMVLLVDLAVSRGDEMPFLGKPAMTSTAAAAFAVKTNALYLPYFSMRNPDRTSFSVELAAPIDHSTPIEMTAAANRELEARIANDPGNWFWIHRRWKPWV